MEPARLALGTTTVQMIFTLGTYIFMLISSFGMRGRQTTGMSQRMRYFKVIGWEVILLGVTVLYVTQQDVITTIHMLFVLHQIPSDAADSMLVTLGLSLVSPLVMGLALYDIHRRPTVRVAEGGCPFWLTQRRELHHPLDLA